MIYGNKYVTIFILLSFILLVGCSKNFQNFHYDLYDGYVIKGIDNKVELYKNDEVIKIENKDYNIKEIKYNSDVVCLKLQNGKYYMIYYVDSSIYGPYTKETLEETIKNDSTMSFNIDFKNILKVDGLVYE